MPASNSIVQLAVALSERLSGAKLTPAQAKLYSQFSRVRAGQTSLSSWNDQEALARLDEAIRLIDAALLCRAVGDGNWSGAIVRAAEVLEWLAAPVLSEIAAPDGVVGCCGVSDCRLSRAICGIVKPAFYTFL